VRSKDKNIIEKNIVILSEDEKSFPLYFEKFMELKRFNLHKNIEHNIAYKIKDFNKFRYEKHFVKIILSKHLKLKIVLLAPPKHYSIDFINYSLKLTEINNKKIDKIFCVFDWVSKAQKDQHSNYLEAISRREQLKKKNIEIIESVPSYEFWLVAHFSNSSKPFRTNDEVIKTLEDEYKKKFKKEKKYEKGSKEFLEKIVDGKMIKNAINNSKKLDKDHNETRSKDFNPSSKIYRIIEYLDSLTN